jgi:hypothetical protein
MKFELKKKRLDIDGGDQLFVPAVELPLNEASTVAPAPPAKSANKGITVTINRKPKVKVSLAPAKKKAVKPSATAAERFRLTLMRNQLRYEKQFKRLLAPVFRDQRAEALKNLEAHASAYKTKSADQKAV